MSVAAEFGRQTQIVAGTLAVAVRWLDCRHRNELHIEQFPTWWADYVRLLLTAARNHHDRAEFLERDWLAAGAEHLGNFNHLERTDFCERRRACFAAAHSLHTE